VAKNFVLGQLAASIAEYGLSPGNLELHQLSDELCCTFLPILYGGVHLRTISSVEVTCSLPKYGETAGSYSIVLALYASTC